MSDQSRHLVVIPALADQGGHRRPGDVDRTCRNSAGPMG
jgi:hypothetical protein